MSNTLFDSFASYISVPYPGAALSEFNFLTSGFESDVYTFNIQHPNIPHNKYVLRLFNGEGAVERMLRETNGLPLLKRSGVPVPDLLFHETDPQILGKPFEVIEKLDGQALWPLLTLVDPQQADHLLNRFGELLSQLHRLDWHLFTPNPKLFNQNPASLLDEVISQYQSSYTKAGIKSFIQIVDWLEAHKNEVSVHPAVVHQDFHANNVFLCSDDRLYVIDWTQIGVSDYRMDLSWTLMLMGDFGKAEWATQILDAYMSFSNITVENLDYFHVIAGMKLLGSLWIPFTTNPENHDLQTGILKALKNQSSQFSSVTQRIQNITNIQIHEIDTMLYGK